MHYELLRIEDMAKSFSGVHPLKCVSLNIFSGEVLGLVGESGAGKSTLAKILSGIFPPDDGRIYFDDKLVEISSPYVAQKLGISLIDQYSRLITNLSIAENIQLGRETSRYGVFFDRKESIRKSNEILHTLGLFMDSGMKVEDLRAIEKQIVEIAKAVCHEAKLIIIDETYSLLSEKESGRIKDIIHLLKNLGISFLLITSNPEEIMDIADRIAVLRDGYSAGVQLIDECTREKLLNMMLGSEENSADTSTKDKGNLVLKVQNLYTDNLIKEASFELYQGEILGFTGIRGSGTNELMRALFGLERIQQGKIWADGKNVRINRPADAIRQGIAYVPEERLGKGLVANMKIKENISIPILRNIHLLYFIQRRLESWIAKGFMERFYIKEKDINKNILDLSAGDQQKLLIAKWMSIKPCVMILDAPTNGVDLAAKADIYRIIKEIAQIGTGVIVVSSDLKEIVSLCDRAIVMSSGTIKGIFHKKELNQNAILKSAIS